MSTDDTPPEQRALELVADAGATLEQARTLLLARASVAVAAGIDPKTVAHAAGLDPATLRRWLAGRDADHRAVGTHDVPRR